MRTLNGVKLTEKEFKFIKEHYISFAKEENRCSDTCPLWEKDETMSKMCLSIYEKIRYGEAGHWCVCQIFEEFEDERCPCYVYGEDAFRRLAKVVKRLKGMK